MKVTWSARAKLDLGDIASWIAADNPAAARAQVRRILDRARQLVQFPHSGREVLEYDDPTIREFVEGSYRVIYRVRPGAVQVVAVLQAQRLLGPPDQL